MLIPLPDDFGRIWSRMPDPGTVEGAAYYTGQEKQMRAIQTADSVQVVGDEHGFELHVDTDEGDRFVFRIHSLAADFHKNVDATIGEWLDGMDDARATRPAPIDLDAYPLGDPKRIQLEREMNR